MSIVNDGIQFITYENIGTKFWFIISNFDEQQKLAIKLIKKCQKSSFISDSPSV